MKNVEMNYNRFFFTGALKIGQDLAEPKVSTSDKGVITESTGYLTTRKGKNAQGNPYISRSLMCSVETANGDSEYLDISDYAQAGIQRTSMFRAKGSKEMTRIDYALASDPKVVEQCENFLVINFRCEELEFKTLDMGHLIDFMVQHRAELNGKRVVISGNVQVSEYENEPQLKYKLSSCRDAFESEVDDLKVDITAVYTKNAVKAIPFGDLVGQEIRKVPVSIFFTATNKDKSVYLIKSGEAINLNLDMIDFANPEMENAYVYMTQLLNFYNTLDPATKTMVDVELEDMKYYSARFIAHIKSNKKDGDLKEEELTMQEKFYLQMKAKTIEDIKKDRGIKKTTNKMIVIDAIPYDVEEVSVAPEQLNGKSQAPAVVNASQAFAPPTPPTGGTFVPPGMPNFSLGLNK